MLATGFVAYMGRSLAQFLIERRRQSRSSPDQGTTADKAPVGAHESIKLEKKRIKSLAKAEKKRNKKNG